MLLLVLEFLDVEQKLLVSLLQKTNQLVLLFQLLLHARFVLAELVAHSPYFLVLEGYLGTHLVLVLGKLLLVPAKLFFYLRELLLHHGEILGSVELHCIFCHLLPWAFQLFDPLCEFGVGKFEIFTHEFELINFVVEHYLSAGQLGIILLAVTKDVIHSIQKILFLALALRLLNLLKCHRVELLGGLLGLQ